MVQRKPNIEAYWEYPGYAQSADLQMTDTKIGPHA